MRFNVTSAFALTRACVPHMLARRRRRGAQHLVRRGPDRAKELRRLRHRQGGPVVHDQAARRRAGAARAGQRSRRRRGGDRGAPPVPDDEIRRQMEALTPMRRIGSGGGHRARRALALLARRRLGDRQGGRGRRRHRVHQLAVRLTARRPSSARRGRSGYSANQVEGTWRTAAPGGWHPSRRARRRGPRRRWALAAAGADRRGDRTARRLPVALRARPRLRGSPVLALGPDPGWGYWSKPPMVAWLIAATTALCGDGEPCVRLAAPLLHGATARSSVPLGCLLGGPALGILVGRRVRHAAGCRPLGSADHHRRASCSSVGPSRCSRSSACATPGVGRGRRSAASRSARVCSASTPCCSSRRAPSSTWRAAGAGSHLRGWRWPGAGGAADRPERRLEPVEPLGHRPALGSRG